MKKRSKRNSAILEKIDKMQVYPLEDALDLIKGVKTTRFDETVDVAIRLGVDPRKADQMVRGTCALPHGLGKVIRVLVFAKGEKLLEARNAGADYVGGEEYVKKIQEEGWFEFDRVVATPDMMAMVGKLGRILGPRGLMPNPKVGTVTFELTNVILSIKAGQVEFKVDKKGNLHIPVGKASFTTDKLSDNIKTFVNTVVRLKPSTSKGIYLKNISISSTMGPGLKVSVNQ